MDNPNPKWPYKEKKKRSTKLNLAANKKAGQQITKQTPIYI